MADYDNDGDTDLFVTGVYRNILYRNRGDGAFDDVTAEVGISSDHWSIAGSWFDYDNDGLLDLFVANYARWSPEAERFCGDRVLNIRVYCHPKYYEDQPNQLYRNLGDGTFEDVSERSGIAAHLGKAMGVAVADYDQDGFLDVFVTNDKLPNFLFHNNGDGTFEEVALWAGPALAFHGQAISAMAVDFRDYNNDGLPDIFITALAGETFPLFRNEGKGQFRDVTHDSGLAVLSERLSAWSNGFCDFNNDGWKDLFTANSHVNDMIERFEATKYRLANSVFANRGDGTFQDVSAGAGPDFQVPKVHRGHAFADFNGDGRLDLVVSALGEEAELFENVSPGDNRWLIFRLTGAKSNRDGIGAQIRIGRQHNLMTTSIGYASSSCFGVHFGVGAAKTVDRVEILWPSGIKQVLENVATNQLVEVREPVN